MAWKMYRRSDCNNQISEERVKLQNMSSGNYLFEFTGRQWVNAEEKSDFPIFRIIREEDLEMMGESAVPCPSKLPDDVKQSAVLFAEKYKIVVEGGTFSIIPR